MKKIIIAKNAGFCFGVKRAVELAEKENEKQTTTYTLGPLIHNDDAINNLKKQNINPIDMEDLKDIDSGSSIVIRSHGVTPKVKKDLEARDLNIVDATCPYVLSIHRKVESCYKDGYQIVIVGDENHPEVVGINGYCENTAIISKDGSGLDDLPDKVCLIAQTTERLANYEKILALVSEKATQIKAYNTICAATKERQDSAEDLSRQVDFMVVIGGKKSSNSRKLYNIAKKNCKKTIFIENEQDIKMDLIKDENIKIVGLTAGASTPDWVIENVINKIKEM